MSALELKILWSVKCFMCNHLNSKTFHQTQWDTTAISTNQFRARDTSALLSPGLQLKYMYAATDHSVFPRSEVLVQHILCFFVPKAPPKMLAPGGMSQGFLVMHHTECRDGNSRSHHQSPLASWICTQTRSFWVLDLTKSHLPPPQVPCSLRKVDMAVSVVAGWQEVRRHFVPSCQPCQHTLLWCCVKCNLDCKHSRQEG